MYINMNIFICGLRIFIFIYIYIWRENGRSWLGSNRCRTLSHNVQKQIYVYTYICICEYVLATCEYMQMLYGAYRSFVPFVRWSYSMWNMFNIEYVPFVI